MYRDIICLIGAREGSKRIPNKNLADINSKPLIAYSILTARELGIPVYVSTDSMDIGYRAIDYGASVILRPSELASDYSTDYDWISHSLLQLNNVNKILFLRPTTPFREIEIIVKAISSFKEESSSLRSIEPLKEAIEKTFRCNNGYLEPAYPFYNGSNMIYKTNDITNLPNQTFPTAYSANGYVDILTKETILKGSLYGNNIQGFITNKTLEIDEPNDLDYARYLATYME